MIRYYAYYSVGGYKDLYLGNSEMKEKDTYYLPLLPIWEKKADSNEEYAEKLQKCSSLPKIKVATIDDMLGLPSKAAHYFVHGGYTEMLSTLTSGECVLIIRDIEGEQKDDSGRNIPFLISLVADTEEDSKTVACVAAYAAANMSEIKKRLSNSIVYDAEYNGLRFKLSEINEWIINISKTYPADIVSHKGIKTLDVSRPGINYISIPKGLTAEYVSKEIGEPIKKDVVYGTGEYYDASDEKMRKHAIVEEQSNKRMALIKKIGLISIGIGSAAAIAIWYLCQKH